VVHEIIIKYEDVCFLSSLFREQKVLVEAIDVRRTHLDTCSITNEWRDNGAVKAARGTRHTPSTKNNRKQKENTTSEYIIINNHNITTTPLFNLL